MVTKIEPDITSSVRDRSECIESNLEDLKNLEKECKPTIHGNFTKYILNGEVANFTNASHAMLINVRILDKTK